MFQVDVWKIPGDAKAKEERAKNSDHVANSLVPELGQGSLLQVEKVWDVWEQQQQSI